MSILFDILTLLAITQSVGNLFYSFVILCENEYFITPSIVELSPPSGESTAGLPASDTVTQPSGILIREITFCREQPSLSYIHKPGQPSSLQFPLS